MSVAYCPYDCSGCHLVCVSCISLVFCDCLTMCISTVSLLFNLGLNLLPNVESGMSVPRFVV